MEFFPVTFWRINTWSAFLTRWRYVLLVSWKDKQKSYKYNTTFVNFKNASPEELWTCTVHTVYSWAQYIDLIEKKSCPLWIINFPASRGLFSVVFAELTGARKRNLCPGSKWTVLSMRHGYLATEPSRDAMLLCGLSKWQRSNCKQMRERQWAQVMVSKQCREHAVCERCSRPRTAVESKSVSTQGRGLFSSHPSVQRIQRKRGVC